MKQKLFLVLFSIGFVQNVYSSEAKCTKLLAKIIQCQDYGKKSLFLLSEQGYDQQRLEHKKFQLKKERYIFLFEYFNCAEKHPKLKDKYTGIIKTLKKD